MDIIHLIQTAPLIDICILLALFAAFILGVAEGAVRRLLGIGSILAAFLLAANLRGPFGDFLAQNWTQFPAGYDHMLAFGIAFAVLAVAMSIVIQGFYKRTDLYARQPVVDEAVGGILGIIEGLLLLVIAIVIFRTYSPAQPTFPGEIDVVHQIEDLLIHKSQIAGALGDGVVPGFVGVLAGLMPPEIVALFH